MTYVRYASEGVIKNALDARIKTLSSKSQANRCVQLSALLFTSITLPLNNVSPVIRPAKSAKMSLLCTALFVVLVTIAMAKNAFRSVRMASTDKRVQEDVCLVMSDVNRAVGVVSTSVKAATMRMATH